jgi:hypothetical protein
VRDGSPLEIGDEVRGISPDKGLEVVLLVRLTPLNCLVTCSVYFKAILTDAQPFGRHPSSDHFVGGIDRTVRFRIGRRRRESRFECAVTKVHYGV